MIEWNAERGLAGALRVFGGLHAGAVSMRFAGAQSAGNVNENEFGAGVQAGFVLARSKGIGASVDGSYRRVFTRRPLGLTRVAVGLHYSTEVPSAIREFLD